MNKKIVTSSLAAVMLLSAAPISSSAAIQSTNYQDIQENIIQESTIGNVDFNVLETTEFRTIKVQENGKDSIVKFNKMTNKLTIDGELIEDLNMNSMLQGQPRTINGLDKGPQYNRGGQEFTYMGKLYGSTRPLRDSVAVTAAGISAVTKCPVAAIILAMGGTKAGLLDIYYYYYELYEANPLTTNWLQFTVTRLYEDEAMKKPLGGEMTSSVYKINLPNS